MKLQRRQFLRFGAIAATTVAWSTFAWGRTIRRELYASLSDFPPAASPI